MLRDKGLDFEVARLLKIDDRLNLRHERKCWAQWCDFMDKIDRMTRPVTIGMTGKYISVRDSYASIINALEHAGIALGAKVNIEWIDDAPSRSEPTDQLIWDNVVVRSASKNTLHLMAKESACTVHVMIATTPPTSAGPEQP